MPEPELHVRKIAACGPPCESGRHAYHPMSTCDEHEAMTAAFTKLYEQALAVAFAEADRLLITGEGTGEPLGFLAMAELPEPTPGERAFAILEPHLRDVPLYRPKFARGGILPKGFGATADTPPTVHCQWPRLR